MKKILFFSLAAAMLCAAGCQKYDDSALKDRIESLEESVSDLDMVLRAYQKNLFIQSVQQTKDGYVITFSDGSTATITNGKDGKDGADGMDGQNGADGKDGQDGQDGANGNDGQNGQNGTNSNNLIKSITILPDGVHFSLTNGQSFFIPFAKEVEFAIHLDATEVAVLEGGQATTISYTIVGATQDTVVKVLTQDGWKAQVTASSISTGTITVTAPDPIVDSEILILANDGSYHTLMVSLNCVKGAIAAADDAVNINAEGGTYNVKVETNMSYIIDIPDSAKDWLSVKETRAVREDVLTFDVAENTGFYRFATVVLRDRLNNPMQTLVFEQLGTANEIYVEKKGDLEKVLADYDYAKMVSLKISGVLNDVDFLFIYRMMPKLRNLDIADVEITSLPNQAFYNSTNVEYLILPNTLTVIGDEMFYNSKLKDVSIPKTVESIGARAFYGTSLTSIEIYAGVTEIGAGAFQNCTKLATVTFEEGSQLKTIGGEYSDYKYYGAFSGCQITSIKIPASVETIGAAAFKDCSSLKSVTFEEDSQLKTIGGGYYKSSSDYSFGAFSGCASLVSIEIPASVETIEAAAFRNCSSLKTITFEENSHLKTIGGGYYGWSSLANKYYGAFSDCPITSIEIPASVETIEAAAFKGCSKLKTVTFEKGSQLKKIEGGYSYSYFGAFCQLTELMTVDMSECTQVKSIGNYAFYGDNELRLFMIGTATPPYCSSYAFDGINPYSVLKVPSGCADAYKTADGWKNFANISGFDE